MMDEMEDLDLNLVSKLKANKQGALIGYERLEKINKRVGERIKLTGLNYKGIDLEFDIVGVIPIGRYKQSAVMNMDYFNDAIDKFNRDNVKPHPLDQKRLNLIWLRCDDMTQFQQMATRVETSELFTAPAVKCETASSGISSFLFAFRDIIRGVRWLLVPAMLVVMILVIANAIGISVRERRTEMAVLKVLGFGPNQVLILVLGEALIVGGGSGLLSAAAAYGIFDYIYGGIPFSLGFFPTFLVPLHALWWGLAIGLCTAFLGSILPAWSARSVRVSEVFAKVA
jgi:putative ABC transport system permease protein